MDLRDGRDPRSLQYQSTPVDAHLLSALVVLRLGALVIKSFKNVPLCRPFATRTHCSLSALKLLPLLEGLLIKIKEKRFQRSTLKKGSNPEVFYIFKYIVKYIKI